MRSSMMVAQLWATQCRRHSRLLLLPRAVRPRRPTSRGRRAAQGGRGVSANSVFSWCASLWPCTEPSNRSGGSEKHAPISDIIYYNSNVWHSTLQTQKGLKGQNPFSQWPTPCAHPCRLTDWRYTFTPAGKKEICFLFFTEPEGDVLILRKIVLHNSTATFTTN